MVDFPQGRKGAPEGAPQRTPRTPRWTLSTLSLCAALLILSLATGCGREAGSSQPEDAPPSKAAAESKAPLDSRPVPDLRSAPDGRSARDPRPVIVAFGDSLTAGFGVDPSSSYPALLERMLAAKGRPYRVVNAGISGDTTSGGLTRVDTVLAYQPKIVILELGANDGLRGLPVESTRANLEQILVALQNGGAKVILAGMTLPPNYGPDYIHSFEQIFPDLSKKYATPRIPFLLENVAGHPDRMQTDGLHPNTRGHRIVAANVMAVLGPLLN